MGISGHIGSGKDTVAKMIQYLSDWKKLGFPSEDYIDAWLKGNQERYDHPTWEIKKFAGKLKEICSLLTGISVSQFEQQSVKDSFLGPEWDYTNFIPMDSHWLRMKEEKGWTPPFCINCKSVCKLGYYVCDTCLASRKSHWTTEHGGESHQMKVRELLQKMGTDAMRDKVHPNIHINALFADYKGYIKLVGGTTEYYPRVETYPNWIISDLRFPNEAQSIKDRGGVCIRINRRPKAYILTDTDSMTRGAKEAFENWIKPHESESALDNYQFDAVIENNDSLEILLKNVKATLYTLNLLK